MTAQVKPARKGKTLAALERAAMKFYEVWNHVHPLHPKGCSVCALIRACAAHAASKK